MSRNAILCLLAAAMLGGLAAIAQDDAPPSTAGDRDSAGSEETDAVEAPQSDDVFIPSEEVQAAEELAFPVNI